MNEKDTIKDMLFDQNHHIDMRGVICSTAGHIVLTQNGNSIIILTQDALKTMISRLQDALKVSENFSGVFIEDRKKEQDIGDMHG